MRRSLRPSRGELSSHGTVHHVAADVSDAAAVEAATDATISALGGIDILVANAGIAGPNLKVWEYPVEAWQQVIDINLTGVFNCCRAVVPHMIRQNYGRIVNTASIAGKEGNPTASAYSASKAGVIALTKSLGKELAGHDIAVNCITPAAAQTKILEQCTQAHIDYMLVEDPARAVRDGGRDRGDGGVAGVEGELVHDRRRVRPERGPGDVLIRLQAAGHGLRRLPIERVDVVRAGIECSHRPAVRRGPQPRPELPLRKVMILQADDGLDVSIGDRDTLDGGGGD